MIAYSLGAMQEEVPLVLRWRNHGPVLRGWLAGAFSKPIAENPFKEYEAGWAEWRDGWFAADRGEEATYQPDDWDGVPND